MSGRVVRVTRPPGPPHRELPLDRDPLLVALTGEDHHLPPQHVLACNAPREVLPDDRGEFNLCHVQPTGLGRGIAELV